MTRLLQTLLFGVTPTDPLVFTAVTLLLTVGLMAARLPARRATRIDPLAALRAELASPTFALRATAGQDSDPFLDGLRGADAGPL